MNYIRSIHTRKFISFVFEREAVVYIVIHLVVCWCQECDLKLYLHPNWYRLPHLCLIHDVFISIWFFSLYFLFFYLSIFFFPFQIIKHVWRIYLLVENKMKNIEEKHINTWLTWKYIFVNCNAYEHLIKYEI